MTRRVLWWLAIACSALSCTDGGVVGVEPEPCGEACPAGEHCQVELDMCVECEQNAECVTAALPYCEAFECVACRAGEPCASPPPCEDEDCPEPCPDGGACVRCEEDSDCDGSGDQQCEDGFCVLEE